MKVNLDKFVKADNRKYFAKNYQYYLMLLIPLLYYAVFKYAPLYGIVIAFKDYSVFYRAFNKKYGVNPSAVL